GPGNACPGNAGAAGEARSAAAVTCRSPLVAPRRGLPARTISFGHYAPVGRWGSRCASGVLRPRLSPATWLFGQRLSSRPAPGGSGLPDPEVRRLDGPRRSRRRIRRSGTSLPQFRAGVRVYPQVVAARENSLVRVRSGPAGGALTVETQ